MLSHALTSARTLNPKHWQPCRSLYEHRGNKTTPQTLVGMDIAPLWEPQPSSRRGLIKYEKKTHAFSELLRRYGDMVSVERETGSVLPLQLVTLFFLYIIIRSIYKALFSALEQTRCAYVACDSERVTASFYNAYYQYPRK